MDFQTGLAIASLVLSSGVAAYVALRKLPKEEKRAEVDIESTEIDNMAKVNLEWREYSDKLESRLKQIEDYRDSDSKRIMSLENENRELKSRLSFLEDENRELKTRVGALEKENARLEAENKQLRGKRGKA